MKSNYWSDNYKSKKMLDRLFFNKITPYDRSFIHIQADEKVFMLPAINTAVFFLVNSDTITINDLSQIEKLPYIDYQLLASEKTLQEEMEQFKEYVKRKLYDDNFADFQVINKQIIGTNVYVILRETQLKRF